MTRWPLAGACLILLVGAASGACTDDVLVGLDLPRDGGAGTLPSDAASGNAGTSATAGVGGDAGTSANAGTLGDAGASEPTCQPVSCQGKIFRCGDCIDNDGDGAVNAEDSQCLGPCDDTEDSLFLDLPGGNGGGCREDCYFDRNSGSGNDGCRYSASCDPLSVAPDYPPSGSSSCALVESGTVPGLGATCDELAASQPQACLDACLPLTPNGCDCFGCCELPAGSQRYVWLGSSATNGQGTCTEDVLDDPSLCRPCTPVPSCFNDCGPCEVCAGRPTPDPSCNGGGPRCTLGRPACGQIGEAACNAGSYCITGCCIPEPR